MPDLAVGSTFAGCLIEGVAGAGGMGVVYRARQVALDRTVAVKLISSQLAGDPSFRERFQREARIAASIDHPNVIPIYEAGEAEGQLFLVMKYVEGTDVGGLIAREGRLAPQRAAEVVSQVAGALDAAHASGLVHRDIKPGNVLISGSSGAERVFLTDFGLSKRAASDASLTGTDHWVGTLHYVSPEQIQGQRVDARADVYSLGCLLYEALTGKVPFERADNVATMFAHMQDPPPVPSATIGISTFDAVVRRALAKDPADRYQSAGDLGRAALAAAADRPISQPERSVALGAASPDARSAQGAPVVGAPPLFQPSSGYQTWNPPAPPSPPEPPPRSPFELAKSPFEQPSHPIEAPRSPFEQPPSAFEAPTTPLEQRDRPAEAPRSPFKQAASPFEQPSRPAQPPRSPFGPSARGGSNRALLLQARIALTLLAATLLIAGSFVSWVDPKLEGVCARGTPDGCLNYAASFNALANAKVTEPASGRPGIVYFISSLGFVTILLGLVALAGLRRGRSTWIAGFLAVVLLIVLAIQADSSGGLFLPLLGGMIALVAGFLPVLERD